MREVAEQLCAQAAKAACVVQEILEAVGELFLRLLGATHFPICQRGSCLHPRQGGDAPSDDHRKHWKHYRPRPQTHGHKDLKTENILLVSPDNDIDIKASEVH